MRLKPFLRPSLAIVFGFIGALVARGGTPSSIFAIGGEYFLVIAVLAFGTLGFILPELAELAWKTGVATVARQIVSHLPTSMAAPTFPTLPFKRGSKKANPKITFVLDTSVLIDGRLLDVVRVGFISGVLLVIPSVVSELHKLADSADDLKRARGRRGLDILAALKKEKGVKMLIPSREPEAGSVDEKLVRVAGSLKARLVTLDFNLSKVGSVRGVKILNLNELANALKTAVLPHEVLAIKVNAVGKEKDQGVGYLSDGTMVVVAGGAKMVGQTIDVEVLRVIATAAGKMIFAKPQ